MGGRVDGDLEQRLEQVLEDLLEALDAVVAPVDVEQPGHLDQPHVVVRVHVISNGPVRQLVPLIRRPAIHGEPQLEVLIFGLIEVRENLVEDPGKVPSPDVVVGL